MGSQALVHLLDPFLRLSLVRECPATYDRTDCHPIRKTLFLRKAHRGFGAFLGPTRLATELMAYRRTTQGKVQAIRVCHLLCPGQCLVVACPRLVRRAQQPQHPSIIAAARHPSVLPIEERKGTVLLRIVQGYPLRKVGMRLDCPSPVV